jgi:hypothetical protein
MNMPRKAEDLLGRYAKFLLHMTQGVVSGLKGESPVFEYRKARRDLLPAQVQRTLDALDILEQGAYVSPISRERTAVDNPYTAALQRVLGFMPPRVSAAFEASEEIRTKKDHYANLSRNMRERLVDAMARGDTMEVNDVFEDVGNRVLKAVKDLRKATDRKDKMAQAGAMAELIFWKRWIQNDDAVKDAYERRWVPQQVESVRSAPFYLRSWGWQKQQSYSIGGGD